MDIEAVLGNVLIFIAGAVFVLTLDMMMSL